MAKYSILILLLVKQFRKAINKW